MHLVYIVYMSIKNISCKAHVMLVIYETYFFMLRGGKGTPLSKSQALFNVLKGFRGMSSTSQEKLSKGWGEGKGYFNILYIGEMEFDFTLEGERFVGGMGLGKGWTKGLQTWNPARLGCFEKRVLKGQ